MGDQSKEITLFRQGGDMDPTHQLYRRGKTPNMSKSLAAPCEGFIGCVKEDSTGATKEVHTANAYKS